MSCSLPSAEWHLQHIPWGIVPLVNFRKLLSPTSSKNVEQEPGINSSVGVLWSRKIRKCLQWATDQVRASIPSSSDMVAEQASTSVRTVLNSLKAEYLEQQRSPNSSRLKAWSGPINYSWVHSTLVGVSLPSIVQKLIWDRFWATQNSLISGGKIAGNYSCR